MNRRILIVGQAPGAAAIGLEPWIHTYSGRRLARMLDVDTSELLDHVDGDNVVLDTAGTAWSGDATLGRAVLERNPDHRLFIFAGPAVARALGCGIYDLLTWHGCRLRDGRLAIAATMPHPSGANRWWNSHANRIRATHWLHDAVHNDGWLAVAPPRREVVP